MPQTGERYGDNDFFRDPVVGDDGEGRRWFRRGRG
jgi:hypothetical protein